ncbi:MAG: 50S ribosomal protein L1 [Candidatus Thermoplasmatota archaeon]|jgi:large subunit ribosomal protein L1|nr:50S ribosomal protein L1 [Candidatus Thermoplasmatota archaeon]MCL5789537.1 50S ribosomal protein L1 [Candidatus Thermoplasmatota archaeon]
MDGDTLKKSLEEAISKSPKRKFGESVDIAINLKDVDLSNPKNRINEEIVLPNGRGRKVKVGLISGNELASKAKGSADKVISAEELDKMSDDKRATKKMVNDIDFFIAEVALMPRVGKILGGIMGPRGKMPRPIPANVDPVPIINNLRRTVKARSKEKPVVHVPIGSKDMEIEKITQNGLEVLKRIESKLEKGEDNIRTIYVKTTMGPAVKVEVK